jgi:hypothetical protein
MDDRLIDLTDEEVKILLLEIAEVAYKMHEHGEQYREWDKIRPLLRKLGYKFDNIYDDEIEGDSK